MSEDAAYFWGDEKEGGSLLFFREMGEKIPANLSQ